MKPYILEYLHNQLYIAVVVGISYESPIMYLEDIEYELKNKEVNGKVLFDMLLHSGNGLDRFFEMNFNGNVFEDDSAKTVRLERLAPIRKKSCEILTTNYEFVEDSILNKQQKQLIRHGCCI